MKSLVNSSSTWRPSVPSIEVWVWEKRGQRDVREMWFLGINEVLGELVGLDYLYSP